MEELTTEEEDEPEPPAAPAPAAKHKKRAAAEAVDEAPPPLTKKQKKEQKRKAAAEAAAGATALDKLYQTGREDAGSPGAALKLKPEPKAASAPSAPKAATMKKGVTMTETRAGQGKQAVAGSKVLMYYTGRLAKGKKRQFDACTSGKPFAFTLGVGEVIAGWDIGVMGMRPGAKRKLTIPAPAGYGKRGAPPDIPPVSLALPRRTHPMPPAHVSFPTAECSARVRHRMHQGAVRGLSGK